MALRDLNPRTAARFDQFLDGLTTGEKSGRDGIDPALIDAATRLQRSGGSNEPSPMPARVQATVPALGGWTPATRVPTGAGSVRARWRPGIAGSFSAATAGLLCLMLVLGMLFTLDQGHGGSGGADRSWLYLADTSRGRLVELDASTLDETSTVIRTYQNLSGTTAPDVSYSWLVSGDGSTVIEMEQKFGVAGFGMPTPIYRVFDARTGLQRSVISRMAAFNASLSNNGRYLVLENANNFGFTINDHSDLSRNPPPEWWVYDTYSGNLVSTITSPDRSPVGGALAVLSPDSSKLLFLAVPSDSAYPGPWSVQLVVYDLATGQEIGRVDLPEVRAGLWPTGEFTAPGWCAKRADGSDIAESVKTKAYASVAPGMAMSPDGREVAIVHADSNRVTLVDLGSLAKTSTVTFDPPLAPSTVFDQSCVRGESRQREALYSTDGRSLYLTGYEIGLVGGSGGSFTDLGVRRLDLSSGELTQHADPIISNRAVFRRIVGESGGELFAVLDRFPPPTPNTPLGGTTAFQRLDAISLNLLAQRELIGSGQLLLSPVQLAPLEPAATPVAMDGVVTLEVHAVGGDIASLRIVADGVVVFDGPLAEYEMSDPINGDRIVITSSDPGHTVVAQKAGPTTLMRNETQEYP